MMKSSPRYASTLVAVAVVVFAACSPLRAQQGPALPGTSPAEQTYDPEPGDDLEGGLRGPGLSLPIPDPDASIDSPVLVRTEYNVGLAVSETLLNEVAPLASEQCAPIRDVILGADVTGSQRTASNVRIDCQPDGRTARFDVVLESQTTAHTVGYRPDATVATDGCHRAELIKPVFFDGYRTTTLRPQGFIRARNTNRDVTTPYSRMPLVGPIADQYARSEVERMRLLAETIAAERLMSRIVPEFNRRVDAALSELNQSLRNQVQPWLDENRLMPVSLATSSSDSELRIRARFGEGELIAAPQRRVHGRLASLMIHQSAINRIVDELGLAGREIADQEMQQLLERATTSLAVSSEDRDMPSASSGDEDVTDTSRPLIYTILFADQTPASVSFETDRPELVLRFGVRPILGPEVPLQDVRIPLSLTLEDEQMRLGFGEVRVTPADGSAAGLPQNLIAQQITPLLKPVTLPRSRTITVSDDRTLTAALGQVEASDGWLLIAVD